MRIRVAPKGRVERVDQRARLGGILSSVWNSVAMISSLRLAPKRLPLRQPCRGGARPFAQVLAAIVLLVIATVAASTVARRLPLRPSVREREAAIDPGESPLRNWLPRYGAREVGAPYFLLPARRRSTAGRAVRVCASGRALAPPRAAGFSLASSAVGAATPSFSSDALNAAIRSITWPRHGSAGTSFTCWPATFCWAACRSWPAPVRDCR